MGSAVGVRALLAAPAVRLVLRDARRGLPVLLFQPGLHFHPDLSHGCVRAHARSHACREMCMGARARLGGPIRSRPLTSKSHPRPSMMMPVIMYAYRHAHGRICGRVCGHTSGMRRHHTSESSRRDGQKRYKQVSAHTVELPSAMPVLLRPSAPAPCP